MLDLRKAIFHAIALRSSSQMDQKTFDKLSKNLWSGFLPVEFSLSENDVSVREIPTAVHILVSRYAYLTAAAFDVVEYFQRSAIDFSTDIWYSFDGVPLRR